MKYLKYLILLVLLLFAFFLIKGLLTPSIYYESETIVNKSAKEAWAVMSDEANLPKWIKGFQRTELVSGTANTVGAVSHVYVNENGKESVMVETIKEINPPELLVMDFSLEDFMDMEYEMSLQEKDGMTTIVTKSKTIGNGMFAKIIVAFMGSAMKSQEDENLGNLKKIIEENTKNYFPEPVIDMVEEVEN